MLDVLKSKVEGGVIESSDLPRLPTIQGWMFIIEGFVIERVNCIQHSYVREMEIEKIYSII